MGTSRALVALKRKYKVRKYQRQEELVPLRTFLIRSRIVANVDSIGFVVRSHTLTKCVEWGLIEENPFWQVRKGEYTPQDCDRYVTDEEFAAVYALAPERIRIAMDLTMLTGLRRSGILTLDLDAETDDGLLVLKPGKKTKGLLFEWSDELRDVVGRAKKLEPRVRRPLLCTRKGTRYTGDVFETNWQRLILKALKSGVAISHNTSRQLAL